MEFNEILLSVQEPIGFLTLNNPEKANALSLAMINEMKSALEILGEDESVKVIIVKAAGKNFCAGHYLAEMTGKGVKEYKRIFDQCNELMRMVHEVPQPVVAQIQGVATAAGCQLAAWADLAIAEENARFATPGVRIGLFCSTPMVAITRAIGRKAAMEMLLTGRYFSAVEAKELGLINRVVPMKNLEEETEKLALQIARASRFVLSVGKQAFYAQIDQPDDKAFHYAKTVMTMNSMAEDARDGIEGFLNKKPLKEWKNR